MFKLAIIIFMAMTFGYIFGRMQQFSIDDSVPLLFIVEKNEQEKDRIIIKHIRFFCGIWITNENLEEFFSKGDKGGLLIQSDKEFSMFFPIETDELKDKHVFVNSVRKSKLKNHGYVKRKFYTAKYVKI